MNDTLATPPSNIQCFEAATAAILAELYRNFPKPVHLETEKFEEKLINEELLPPSCLWEKRLKTPCLVGSTTAWLHEEGLVRYGTVSEPSRLFTHLVLTAKGFAALNQPVVSSVNNEAVGETVGDKFMGVGKYTAKTAVTTTIQTLVKSLINFC